VPFTQYEATRVYRSTGANAAAKQGAVAMLLRSVASFSINSPHTGTLSYESRLSRGRGSESNVCGAVRPGLSLPSPSSLSPSRRRTTT